jgi:hypothetical protein
MARHGLDEMRAELAALRKQVAGQQQEIDSLRTRSSVAADELPPVNGKATRRQLLKRIGLGAAGAAAAGAGLATAARPAFANDGDSVLIANSRFPTSATSLPTRLYAPSATDRNPSLLKIDNYTSTLLSQPANSTIGIIGTASGGDTAGRLQVGVYGATENGDGVWGQSASGNALNATTATGTGVAVNASGTGSGVVIDTAGTGDGIAIFAQDGINYLRSATNVGLWVNGFSAAGGRIFQAPGSTADPNTLTGSYLAGESIRDANGRLWICVSSGTPGTWVQPSAFTPFPDARRVFDGFATPIAQNTTTGPINALVKQAGGSSGVLVGARAAYCAVQVLNHTVTGPLTLFPNGAADPGVANWVANTTGGINLSYMLVPLSAAGAFRIHSYINGNVIVDAWGFLY